MFVCGRVWEFGGEGGGAWDGVVVREDEGVGVGWVGGF